MSSLTKGQNGPLAPGPVAVTVDLPAPADLSALLVTAAGKVRTDADFVFFNQPDGPGVQLQNGLVRIDPSAVPADIEQVRVVITLHDASSSFGQFGRPVARVSDGAGNPLYDYTMDGLGSESVVIALEVYRRQGAWKVRAVGQGYAGGFADLVRDHGVSVDDEPAAPAAPTAPAAPPAPTTPAAPYDPVPQQGTYTPPPAPPSAPGPQGDYAPAAGSAPTDYFSPSYTPPQQHAHQPSQQPSAPAPQAPQHGGEVSLTKNRRVDLRKGQKVVLRKDGGVALTSIMMGLGWDPVQRRGGLFGGGRSSDIDLDASAILYSGPKPVDIVYFGQLSSRDGSVVHSGDNLTGEGEGDDEAIRVDLHRIPPQVTTLLFIVTSYRGQKFDQIANAFCRLVDSTTNIELARYALQGGMPYTAMVMCTLHRQGGEWKMQAVGECLDAKTAKQALPGLGRFLPA
ncbi:TerD family protein [Tsukamurella sp. 8F]|uniref:TerD family protein n=1 Tax=unclassified Tsukamurella TaxID=2633480 RepID=UPI0023B8C49F|nr:MULTISPECIES: TerD family protein [unclassified Tsukamurella]MDF0530439.1 TerD family protein [Tsukamurella sp. 8J]MDF0587740.1 TerD family protein [Tsukamurella sp. 8F]